MSRDETWSLTKSWRTLDIFNEACDRTKEKTGDEGLRRGELFKSISSRISGKDDNEEGIKLDYNLKFLKNKPKKSKALKQLWSWINQCYHINMSNQLKARVNLPKYNPYTDFTAQNQVLKNHVEDTKIHRLPIPVKMCSLESLINLSPNKVVGLSKSWLGEEYRASLREYSLKQNDTNKYSLVKSAQAYCHKICDIAGANDPISSKIQVLSPENVMAGTAALAGLGELIGFYAIGNPEIKRYLNIIESTAVLVPFIKATAQEIKKKSRKTEISIDFINP